MPRNAPQRKLAAISVPDWLPFSPPDSNMATLKPGEVDRFSKNPPANIAGVLIYGPNQSRIAEIATNIVKSVIGTLDDPFNLVHLSENQLKDQSGLLHDEMLAISFTGGRKVVWIKDPGAAFSRQLSGIFGEGPDENLLVVQAGPLTKSSGLRKNFEAATQAVCIPCYEDTARDLAVLITQKITDSSKQIDPGAVNLLIESVGTDRALILSEVEKLLLFCADKETVSSEDISVLSGDPLGGSLDDLVERTLVGDIAGSTNRFRELNSSGIQPAQILVTLANQLTRLQKFRLDIDKGQNLDMVIKSARPPIFFKKQPTTKRQLTIWQIPALEKALTIVFEAILLTRQNANLAESVCERALITIGKTAQKYMR